MAKQSEFDISRSVPIALVPKERKRIEKAIQRALDRADALLFQLDVTDGDPDLEPCCEDEGAACEDEGAQCDDEGAADVDLEPSLGWGVGQDQTRALKQCTGMIALPNEQWVGRAEDLELDTADFEPALGAPNVGFYLGGMDQTRWGAGCTDDREEDCEGEGACETALVVL